MITTMHSDQNASPPRVEEPGAVASEVARAAGIHTSQLFRWRQQLCERTQGSGGV